MDSSSLRSEISFTVEEVSSLLAVPVEAAAILLRHFKFNKEKTIEKFYENSEKVVKDAGVAARCADEDSPAVSTPSKSPKSKKKKVAVAEISCGICMDDFSPSETYSMPCGHPFCTNCYTDFINNKVSDGPNCVYAKCPEFRCNELISEKEVNDLNKSLLEKFEEFQLRAFVDLNKLSRWCPAPDCTKIGVTKTGYGDVNCSCGTEFCVRCGVEPHAPSICTDLERWTDKNENESETANWILANTKKCPKCYTRIEKNQGCNHIACQQCKFDFCWICLQDWKEHGSNTGGYYKCNR